tara:strand:+ start:805 stop:1014 length:210 start_codon:yes stop_codon:yes gene_type:complete
MDDLIDMMVADKSANDVSDKIKEILYAKSAEKVDASKPSVGVSMFGDQEVESELETETEVDQEEEPNGD